VREFHTNGSGQSLDCAEDVPIPSDYGLPYEDLELKTPDGITLRCYLLPQSRELSKTHSAATPLPEEEEDGTEDAVCVTSLSFEPLFIPVIVHSQSPNGHDVPRKWYVALEWRNSRPKYDFF
jgi:hypothetical protein